MKRKYKTLPNLRFSQLELRNMSRNRILRPTTALLEKVKRKEKARSYAKLLKKMKGNVKSKNAKSNRKRPIV